MGKKTKTSWQKVCSRSDLWTWGCLSRYYTAEEYEQETSSTDGSYVGIGISMEANKEGGVKIAECYEGGPGEIAGLEEGDVISAIDGEDIQRWILQK